MDQECIHLLAPDREGVRRWSIENHDHFELDVLCNVTPQIPCEGDYDDDNRVRIASASSRM